MSTSTTPFSTTREVAAAIASLGFQPSTITLEAISRTCRDEFVEHLARCVSGQDTDDTSKKFVGNLIRCLSPDTLNRLKAIVPTVLPDQVVPLARQIPARLLSAIEAASDPAHAKHSEALAFLQSKLPSHTAEPPQRLAEPLATLEGLPSEYQARCRPEPTTHAPEPQGKPYHSCHVYGSSYALCFNATTRDGTPGVMVDAAVSNGPKSYDWRNAIHIWLNVNEVGAVLAVFRRWRKSVEFGSHGAQNDKSFGIEFQGAHFYAKVSARKEPNHPTRAVKILPTDATAVSILFMTQLADSYPAIPLNELLATVRATHQSEHAGQ